MILNPSTVEVKRQFHAPAAKVFDAIGAGVLFRTCGAAPDSIKVDFREGGAWSVLFPKEQHRVEGKILSLVQNRKIVFTWGGNGTVTINLSESGGVTSLHLLHEGIQENVNDFDWGWRDGVNDFTPTQTRTITVTREFAAPVARVFALFSDPRFFTRCKANPDSLKTEFRVGGKYSFDSLSDCSGKTEKKSAAGEFTDIQPDKRIAFTWDVGALRTLVLIDFKATDKGTLVTLKHAGFPDEASASAHEGGWTSILSEMI